MIFPYLGLYSLYPSFTPQPFKLLIFFILFSFSSDKDRRTDGRIRRKNTAQPRRESNRGSCEFDSRRGFAVFPVRLDLIRLSVLLSLCELKEKRIWFGMIPTRASLRFFFLLSYFWNHCAFGPSCDGVSQVSFLWIAPILDTMTWYAHKRR